jgi:DNA/RNA endonuclease YhcR with UshA esterase domain
MKCANMRFKVFSLIVLATATVLNPAQADDTNSIVPAKIGAIAASKHVGENMIVTGKVVEVAVRPKVVILYFEQPSTNSLFTGVIFTRYTNLFGDLSSLKDKSVEVKGMIKNYQGKPEIILTSTNQLTISAAQPGTADHAPAPVPKQP